MSEEIECIFCNKTNNNVYIEENGYQGKKCLICNLIYISPRPTIDEMQFLYNHDNAQISARGHIDSEFEKRLYAKHNLKIVKKFITYGSILEIGCGAGYFLDEARKGGFEPYGIELNKVQANFINKALKISCEESLFQAGSFGDKKFDIIYHCDVLSHFFDPVFEFKKMSLKLNKNGIVVFETGNLGDVSKKYLSYIENFQYPDHLFFFSEKNIRDLLEKTGFELLKVYRYGILPQLFINKLAKKVKKLLKHATKSKLKSNKKSQNSMYDSKNNKAKKSRLIKTIYCSIVYFMRYKLGYIIPKKAMPQTVIVVARKKSGLF